MSKLEAWIRCDGLRSNRRVCGVSVAEDAVAGWHHVGEEDLHICPAHLGILELPNVLPRDSVLVLQEDGALTHATVEKTHHDGARVLLADGGRPVPLRSVVVLAPHAGG
jgi:hypothetical protein